MAEQVEELQPLLEADQFDFDDADEIVLPPRRRFPIWAIVLIVVLVLALIAASISYYLLNRTPAIQYIQSTVQSGNLSVKVSTSGPLAPNAQYIMNFPAAGQISEVDVKVGDHVTAGQTLAKITVTQTVNGYGNNPPTTTDTLTAPGDATVATVNGTVGENVSSNGSVSTGSSGSGQGSASSSSAFMTLVDVSKYVINASINESDITSIKVGQVAQFTVSAYPSTTLRATVTSIDILGQSSSSVVTYPVQLAVDMSSVNTIQLFPGMTATVDITTAQRLNTLIIPASALSFPTTALQNGEINRTDYRNALQAAASSSSTNNTGSTTGAVTGNTRVVMELKDGKLVPVPITVGLTSNSSVEVLSGLKEGDQIVTGQTGGTTTSPRTGTNAGGRGGFGGGGGGFGGGFGGGNGGRGAGGNGGN
ncbi:efflux RND transporter periplasmic adaptor subunit [Tengunoibacter tsumagoiensis]|uniref:AprE-like beta-barrel domain-containing protein n=1 Tax=Tengunoibacter tsumagoiensis TaxID=2014871 RepID=A0A402AAG9_9CHLR|nr:HlyD family efflux transporter periplasmic adaptor subunit [Tengunoibacter tsumagoiensis]GCE16036.1 hypothetical protein KTT_58950 [Tengunoibacter tsumagoiensis]